MILIVTQTIESNANATTIANNELVDLTDTLELQGDCWAVLLEHT
jgi:hypothetical protein